MSDRDFAPLSSACVRALNDKLYDKRKIAALEIQKMVREFADMNNTSQITKLLRVLGQDFANSPNAQTRKGGLIGLAAVAIALGKDTANYADLLITPILSCFSDADSRVRYAACESLFNVVKVTRSAVLVHFTAIFSGLIKIATDPEQTVKNASELLDRLMKDIVTESHASFDMSAFVPLLREHLYTRSPFARQFLIAWVGVLDAAPDLDLVAQLPEMLDGLLRILGDPNTEVARMCDAVLGELLRGVKVKSSQDVSRVDFAGMINVLIDHAQEKTDGMVQLTAITWIKEFVQLAGVQMLPFMAGIFTAVLPCLAYDVDSRRMTDIKETANNVNFTLMKLITTEHNERNNLEGGDESTHITKELNLKAVVDVLTQYLSHNSVQTKVAVLKWIHHLYLKVPEEMFTYIDVLFPALQRTLSDPSDEVVQQCLIVIADIISLPGRHTQTEGADVKTTYYTKFLVSLLQSFSKDKTLLNERGSFIIRQLCVLLNAEDIYRTLAEILLNEENLRFASLMVQQLNMILLTSSELFELRTKLKHLNTKESCSLFCCLYETWCHNPVATLALCLLTQSYNHVCDLILLFGNLEITVEFLTEIDKLIQLIESPIFAYLRLELLQVPCDQSLVRVLYGLLMLLPQTEAFHTLRIRLSCIPSLHLHCDNTRNQTEIKPIAPHLSQIDYDKLLQHFKNVQKSHRQYKKTFRAKEISTLERDTSQLEL